jgi:hypothetical protein
MRARLAARSERHAIEVEERALPLRPEEISDAIERVLPERLRRRVVPFGEHHALAKLTDADVRAIRAALRDGATQRELADKFSVSVTVIHCIGRRKTWRHVR